MKILIFSLALLLFSCGKKQSNLSQMLIDYPEMACEAQDSLLMMAQEQGARWSPDLHPTSSGTNFEKGIMLKRGMSGPEAWSTLFFETYNLKSEKKFIEIYDRALSKGIDRYDWVEENAKIEYENAQAFLKFASDTLRPFYLRHGMETTELDRMMNDFSKPFSTWMKAPESEYPWNYWGNYYDTYLK
jgi:hypothetical protein